MNFAHVAIEMMGASEAIQSCQYRLSRLQEALLRAQREVCELEREVRILRGLPHD